MIDRLLAKIAPHHCLGCDDIGNIMCESCKNYINDEPFFGCILCTQPANNDNLCSSHTLPYQRAWCVALREGVLAKTIDAYKFERALAAANALASLLDERLPNLPPNTVLVPIPPTPNSLRVRGYDHTMLISRELARLRSLQVDQVLKRNNNITQHFTKLASQRKKQAKTFFSLRQVPLANSPHLIIDDILTTGATVEAATKCLTEAGVVDVWVAVLSRH